MLNIQKDTIRTRLMALPDVSLMDAESITNGAIARIRKTFYNSMDWAII